MIIATTHPRQGVPVWPIISLPTYNNNNIPIHCTATVRDSLIPGIEDEIRSSHKPLYPFMLTRATTTSAHDEDLIRVMGSFKRIVRYNSHEKAISSGKRQEAPQTFTNMKRSLAFGFGGPPWSLKPPIYRGRARLWRIGDAQSIEILRGIARELIGCDVARWPKKGSPTYP